MSSRLRILPDLHRWDPAVWPGHVERSERYSVYSTSTVLFRAASGASSAVSPNQERCACSALGFHRGDELDRTREYSHRVHQDFSTSDSRRHAPQLPLMGHTHVDDDSGHTVHSGIISSRGRRRHSWHDVGEFQNDSHLQHNIDLDHGVQELAPPYTPRSNHVAHPVLDISYFPRMGVASPLLHDISQRPSLDVHSVLSTQLSSLGNLARIGEEGATDASHSSASTSSSERDDTRYDRRGRSMASLSNVFDVVKRHAARSLSPSTHRSLSPSHTHTGDSDYPDRLSISTRKESNISRLFRDVRDTLSCGTRDISGQSGCGSCSQKSTEAWMAFQKGMSPTHPYVCQSVNLSCAGTYNYPIFFTLPPDAPSTTKAEYGSFTWHLNAKVKRPGCALRSTRMMVAHKDVEVVFMPADDPLDEPSESATGIHLQRVWDAQFQYRLDVFQRNSPLGGILPLRLAITPLKKIKVHQVAVYLEGKGFLLWKSPGVVLIPARRTRRVLLSLRLPRAGTDHAAGDASQAAV